MTDLPPGVWSHLLVGHQWPDETSLTALQSAVVARSNGVGTLDSYADLLRSIRLGSLASQEGATADSHRAVFITGEDHSRDVAEKNRHKVRAYTAAIESVESLRGVLSDIAADGNRAIEEICESPAPTAAKLPEIVRIISQAQADSNHKSALCAAAIYAATESVLANEGSDVSARRLATAQGLDIGGLGAVTDIGAIQREVSDRLVALHPTSDEPNPTGSGGSPEGAPVTAASVPSTNPSTPEQHGQSGHTPAYPTPTAPQSPSLSPAGTTNNGDDPVVNGNHGDDPVVNGHSPQTSVVSGPASLDSGAASPGEGTGSPVPGASTASVAAADPGAEASPPGKHDSASISTAAGSITAAAIGLSPGPAAEFVSDSIAESHTEASLSAATTTAAHDPTPATSLFASAAAPVPPTVGTSAPAANPALPGPLLGYGTDWKPPTATPAPAAPNPPAIPGSATPQPASSAAPTGQPAVVRRQSMSSAHPPSGAGLTERAFAAGAAGSAMGATPARAAKETRLRRILRAVADQQPQLRWAIGDLDDGTTVLVTDLASGWIPPHIRIPTGVALLEPGVRRGGLAALLGRADVAAFHEPGQPLTPDAERVPISTHARDTAAVEDLGWELSQATKWRDGLPRLAHTLARAAWAGTGYLESEVGLLRAHLRATADSVLCTYPDKVDPMQVADWQLLATIDALVTGRKDYANYHFAWFLTQVPAREKHP